MLYYLDENICFNRKKKKKGLKNGCAKNIKTKIKVFVLMVQLKGTMKSPIYFPNSNHSTGHTLFKFTIGLTWHENNGYTDTP